MGAVWFVVKTLLGLGLVVWGVLILHAPESFIRKAFLGKDEFIRLARTISADKIDPANQGQPVVVTGMLTGSKEPLVDSVLGAKIPGVVSAYRLVEMFQNDEVWTGSGDNERMSGHRQVWSEEPYTCPSKPNPPFPLSSKFFLSPDCRVGKFSIPKEMAGDISGKTVLLPSISLDRTMAALGEWESQPDYYFVTRSQKKAKGVGNLRIRYKVLEPCEVTVLGVQQGDRIEPFIDMAGGETYAIIKGKGSSASVKKTASANKPRGMGWPRFWAFFPLWLGFGLLISAKLGKDKSFSLVAFLSFLCVPVTMALVHLAVWHLIPRLVV